MSLKLLIKKQKIIIDDHKHGCQEFKEWDSSKNDIHLDKSTLTKVEGKKVNIRIKIPLNSYKEISVSTSNSVSNDIPKRLRDEIKEAFSNRKVREEFVRDLIPILDNFASCLTQKEKAMKALRQISIHFDLDWDTKIEEYYNNAIGYSVQLSDSEGEKYQMSIDSTKITIQDMLRRD